MNMSLPSNNQIDCKPWKNGFRKKVIYYMTNFENDLAQTKVPQGPYIKVCHGSAASHSDSPILNLTGTLIKGSPPTRGLPVKNRVSKWKREVGTIRNFEVA